MLLVGLTGGIGSGKTAASDYFQTLDIHVVDADIVAREVVEPEQPAWHKIYQRLGDNILNPDQTLNRGLLRQAVFQQSDLRQWLESVIHPQVRQSTIRQLRQATSPYAILVSPLLFESGQVELVDTSLVIDVPESTQIERACARDNNDEETIKRIIAAQIDRTERNRLADHTVSNTESLEDLHRQLFKLHQSFLQQVAGHQCSK